MPEYLSTGGAAIPQSLSVLVSLQFVPVISLHIFPMVIGSLIALNGKFHLMLIQQYLHKDIVTSLLTEKDKLDVACHRKYLVVPPYFIELIQIGGAIGAIS